MNLIRNVNRNVEVYFRQTELAIESQWLSNTHRRLLLSLSLCALIHYFTQYRIYTNQQGRGDLKRPLDLVLTIAERDEFSVCSDIQREKENDYVAG